MAEVLDGSATAQARNAAIAQVEQWSPSFGKPVVVGVVARQTYTTCRVGQNTWKVKDGYRLRCEAHSLAYYGWDGAFDPGQKTVQEKISSLCTVIGSPEHGILAPYDNSSGRLGGDYSCEGGLRARTAYTSGRSTEETIDPETTWLDNYDDLRWLSGPQGASLLERLQTRRWLLAIDAKVVFYQDEVR